MRNKKMEKKNDHLTKFPALKYIIQCRERDILCRVHRRKVIITVFPIQNIFKIVNESRHDITLNKGSTTPKYIQLFVYHALKIIYNIWYEFTSYKQLRNCIQYIFMYPQIYLYRIQLSFIYIPLSADNHIHHLHKKAATFLHCIMCIMCIYTENVVYMYK